MRAPQVSVLMPVFNAAGVAFRAIESIRQQSLRDWELIVVDDGSTDQTPAMMRHLSATESRLRVITKPHGGIVTALNAGLAEARAPLVARMDADDEAHPDRLAAQTNLLNERPELGLVGLLVEVGSERKRQGDYGGHEGVRIG